MGFQKVEETVTHKEGRKYERRAPVASIATDDKLYASWKAIVDGDNVLRVLVLSKNIDAYNNVLRLALKFAINSYKGGVRLVREGDTLVTTLEGE